MTTENLQNANEILNRLKEAYNMKYDAELANFLDKDPSTISTWRRRNTIDYNHVFSKCHDLNANYILYGDLPIKREAMEVPQVRESETGYDTHNILQKIDNLSLKPDEKIELLKAYLKLLEQKQN